MWNDAVAPAPHLPRCTASDPLTPGLASAARVQLYVHLHLQRADDCSGPAGRRVDPLSSLECSWLPNLRAEAF